MVKAFASSLATRAPSGFEVRFPTTKVISISASPTMAIVPGSSTRPSKRCSANLSRRLKAKSWGMARELRYANGVWAPIGVKVAVYNVCDYALLTSQQIVCHFHEDTSAYLTIGCRCCEGSSSSSSSSGSSSSRRLQAAQAVALARVRAAAFRARHRVPRHPVVRVNRLALPRAFSSSSSYVELIVAVVQQ
jgi:hypothetical protein